MNSHRSVRGVVLCAHFSSAALSQSKYSFENMGRRDGSLTVFPDVSPIRPLTTAFVLFCNDIWLTCVIQNWLDIFVTATARIRCFPYGLHEFLGCISTRWPKGDPGSNEIIPTHPRKRCIHISGYGYSAAVRVQP